MDRWVAFFQAQAGASASLLGLIFVGLSISLPRIVQSRHLPNRALESLAVLLLNLVVSTLFLVPQGDPKLTGSELLAGVSLLWIGVCVLHVANLRALEPHHRRPASVGLGLGQLVMLAWWGGALAVALHGAAAVGWLVPAVLLSYLLALLNAWVLLVEINR